MAISLVGSGVEIAALNGGNATLTLPVGMAADDVVYVFASWSSAILGGGTTSSSGWTQVGSTVDSGTLRTTVWRKTMGGTPDTTFVLVGTTVTSDVCAAVGYALRGVDLTTPEDAAPTTASGSSTNPDAPSITTVTAGAYGIDFAASEVVDGSIVAPTGWGSQVDISANDDQNLTVGGASLLHTTAGAKDPASWTTWSTGVWVAWSLAVRPSIKQIAADSGSFAITGSAATLKLGHKISAAAGTYDITGSVASLEYGFKIIAGSGSYVLTGQDATLSYFSGIAISAGPGSFTLSGSDASLLIGRKIVASSGTFTITGSAAQIEYGRLLTAQGGAYTVTGSDASVFVAGVAVPAASLSVFGTWTLIVDAFTPTPLKVTSQIAAMPSRASFPTAPLRVIASQSLPLRVRQRFSTA